MKQTITWKGEYWEQNPKRKQEVAEMLEKRIARLAPRLRRFPPDAVHLHAVVEENPEGKGGHVSLALRLPSRTLAAHEDQRDFDPALNEAFDELERLLEREKERLRAERRSARRERSARERWLASRTAPGEELRHFDEIEQYIPDVERYVRRELKLCEAFGEVVPREIYPPDIVDAAVSRAIAQLPKKPKGLDVRQFMIGLAARALRAEIDRLRLDRRRAVHIEQDIPETPPEREVSTLGDEILDFYQPDEDLRMEDVIPELSIPTPESAEAERELEEIVNAALSGLPASWREAFMMNVVEGFTVDEIAEATGVPREQVERNLEQARAYVIEHVRAAGFTG